MTQRWPGTGESVRGFGPHTLRDVPGPSRFREDQWRRVPEGNTAPTGAPPRINGQPHEPYGGSRGLPPLPTGRSWSARATSSPGPRTCSWPRWSSLSQSRTPRLSRCSSSRLPPTGPVHTRDKGHTSIRSRAPALRERPVQRGAWSGSRPSRPDGCCGTGGENVVDGVNSCVDKAVDAALLHGTHPADSTVCKTDTPATTRPLVPAKR